jgi:hypothetical protein
VLACAVLLIALSVAERSAMADGPAAEASPAAEPARWELNHDYLLLFGLTNSTNPASSGTNRVGKAVWQPTLDRHLGARSLAVGGGLFVAVSSGGEELGAVGRVRRPLSHGMVASFEAGPSLAWDSGRSTALAVTARVGLDLGRFGAVLETRIPFAELSDVALSTGTRSILKVVRRLPLYK